MIRSRRLLFVGLFCLASSLSLGLLLVHDGEVGTDEALLHYAAAGDSLRLKGTLALASAQEAALASHFGNHSARLVFDDSVTVLIAANAPLSIGESVLVEGAILWTATGVDSTIVVIRADTTVTPLWFR